MTSLLNFVVAVVASSGAELVAAVVEAVAEVFASPFVAVDSFASVVFAAIAVVAFA